MDQNAEQSTPQSTSHTQRPATRLSAQHPMRRNAQQTTKRSTRLSTNPPAAPSMRRCARKATRLSMSQSARPATRSPAHRGIGRITSRSAQLLMWNNAQDMDTISSVIKCHKSSASRYQCKSQLRAARKYRGKIVDTSQYRFQLEVAARCPDKSVSKCL